MAKIISPSFAIFFLLLTFCTGPNDSIQNGSFILDDSFTVHYQDTLFNEPENIRISFDEVFEDSRCPENVVCLWAGNAKLGLTLSQNQTKFPFELNSHGGVRFPKDTTLLSYKIALLDVKPYPHTDSTYTEEDYSATIIVSKTTGL